MEAQQSAGMADLAARLIKRLAGANRDRNLVFSPLSIHAVLALLAAGARGAPQDEILGVLGAPSRAALDEFLSGVAEDALEDHSESGGPRVAFAHGVWTDLACPLKPAYREAVVGTYRAEAHTLDFRENAEEAAQHGSEGHEEPHHGGSRPIQEKPHPPRGR